MTEPSAAYHRAKAMQELMVRKVGGDHSVEAEQYERLRRAFLKPAPRHAELVVNLAGAMALFVIQTVADRAEARPFQGDASDGK